MLHTRFLGDLFALEIAAQGFERPLVTLVREFELPEQGADVRISIDPGSVLVFPAEETSTMDGNLSSER